MGISGTFGQSFRRATISAGTSVPQEGTVFISVNNQDKMNVIPIARDLHEMEFSIVATEGTARELNRNGVAAKVIYKVGEGRPNVVDGIKNGDIQMVINTPLGQQSRYDEESIGRACIQKGIMVITTLSAAAAAVRGIRTMERGKPTVRSRSSNELKRQKWLKPVSRSRSAQHEFGEPNKPCLPNSNGPIKMLFPPFF
jgi:carbamoyl-phosphate synthase large subunit